MKIGVHYSLYSCDDIQNSILYLTRMAYTVKYYNENKLKEHFDLIIHIDRFTHNIFNEILHQEKISKDDIKYVVYERNLGARGMFWRFQAFYDKEYDINVCAEGDNAPGSFFDQLSVFELNKFDDCPVMMNLVRQVQNKNCFDGGRIFFRSKMIDDGLCQKFKNLRELFLNMETIPYGIDEQFMRRFMEKNFRDEKICFCITSTPNVFQKIEDQDKEGDELKSLFKNCTFMKKCEWDSLYKSIKRPEWKQNLQDVSGLELLVEMNGVQYYHYDGGFMRIKQPHRPRKSEFCEQRLLGLIDDII